MHLLDAYTHTNHLNHLPPAQKLGFALVVLGLGLLTHPVPQALIVLWLSLWTVGYARIPAKVYGSVLAVVMVFLFTSLPALVIELVSRDEMTLVQGNSWGGIFLGDWYLFISQTGVMRAVSITMRSLASVSCLLFILFTIPFSELLHVLQQWRIPQILLDLILLMYRFIFLLLDAVIQLQLAQKARGGYRTSQRWMYSVGLLVGQMVVRSLQRYRQLALGLTARGFNGTLLAYAPQSYLYSRRYALESLLGCMGLVMLEVLIYSR